MVDKAKGHHKWRRQEVQRIIGSFEFLAKRGDGSCWVKGEKTAREWLRLIDAEEPTQSELLALLAVVHANKTGSTMCVDLAVRIYRWVQLKGVTVPPIDIFFASDQIPFEKSQIFTPLEYANWLIEHFTQYCADDPGYEAWTQGLTIAQEWLRMINADEVTEDDARSLVEKIATEDGFGSALWYDLEVGVTKWCKIIGYTELSPERWRNHLH